MTLFRRHKVIARFKNVVLVRKFWTTKQAHAWLNIWLVVDHEDLTYIYRQWKLPR